MDFEVKRLGFTIFGNKRDFLKISSTFRWLKMVTGIPKKYLYFQALKWLSEDTNAQQKFLQYLRKEKA
jgi:hypothetical protein